MWGLNPSKCSEYDYINFLIASTKIFVCFKASRCQLIDEHSASHDAFTRLLQRQPPDTEALWNDVQPFVKKETGFLILDDSTLDKPYSQELTLVYRHWSGKQDKVVNDINLISRVWTDGDATIPIDFRIYDIDNDGKTKNDHFEKMLTVARTRGFSSRFVMFDSWYGSIGNLKRLREFHWQFRINIRISLIKLLKKFLFPDTFSSINFCARFIHYHSDTKNTSHIPSRSPLHEKLIVSNISYIFLD